MLTRWIATFRGKLIEFDLSTKNIDSTKFSTHDYTPNVTVSLTTLQDVYYNNVCNFG